MRRSILARLGGPAFLALIAVGSLPGCDPGRIAAPASPVVSPDSEAGKKAREQDEQLRQLREQQEARARKRMKGLPHED